MTIQNLARMFALSLAGCLCSCAPPLSAPTITTIETTADLSYETFCPSSGEVHRFAVDQDRPLSGVMQCRARELLVVVFDSQGTRVRNLRLALDGVIVDETFFMSPDSTPTLVFLTALKNSLNASDESSPRARIRLVSSTH